jgi:lipoprotein-anchoring transpeptidase ErfK/SrfK
VHGPIRAIGCRQFPSPRFRRSFAAKPSVTTRRRPGTIIVDTGAKFLYFVLPGGKAVRYGIGVGREGFEWNGTARIGMKREWPVWTPPSAMIKRQPELAKWRSGMPGGPKNALGARALYLFNKGGDSGYRLHGTPEWWSIGKAMSSGCIRLINQDIIDSTTAPMKARRSSFCKRTVRATRRRKQKAGRKCPAFFMEKRRGIRQ